jgi:signal transduction histidine kinase
MTNGNGAPQTPTSGLPLNGSGSAPNGEPLAFGPGSAGPGEPAGPSPAASPVLATRGSRGGHSAGGKAAGGVATRRGSRFALSNWRVRWRVVAIIAVPTVTALILGAIQIASSVNNYTSFRRVQTLANLNALVVTAAGQLADERDLTAGYVAAGKPAALKNSVLKAEQATDVTLKQISSQATAVTVSGGYRSQTVLDLQNGVLAAITDLSQIRNAALTTHYQPLAIIQSYDTRITAFDTFSNDISAGSGNDTLQTNVAVLNALLRVEDDASLQRADLYQALLSRPPTLTASALSDLSQAQAQQKADLSQFDAVASVTQSQDFSNTVSGQDVDEAESEESLAIALTNDHRPLGIGHQPTCGSQTSATCWQDTQSSQITLMRQVSNGLVGQITAQANSLTSSALRNAWIVSVATLVLLALVLLITMFVARSMIRPLRKLRADALEVAGSKLPDMVRRLSESEGGDESIEIEPIGVTSTDEIGEVARAFDQVHREAVRLAVDEAMLRGNLNAMFVNLSRRSQSLIERQLALIDDLEQTEQDPDRLSSLFRLDHMATRMRRNSENLLVLAGHEASRRWSQPVALVDVLRAAISEIEQYERIVLNVQPGIQVIGQAVNDVVHLVAEIVENATTFSSEDSQVYVTGQPLTSGGVLLDITDNGVGISEQEMAHANWRLDNPPVVDVAVSRRMGLFVVGRLAARHGIRVRLRHAQSSGLTALIWLPESVAAPETAQPLGRLRNFEADDFGPAPSLSAPPAAAPVAAVPRIPRFSEPVFGGNLSQDSTLPTRQPGNNLQSSPGAGAGSVFRPSSTPPGFPSADFDAADLTSHRPVSGDAANGPGDGNGAGTSGLGTSGIGGSDGSQVAIPAAASPAQDQRLPIFDSLESDWFRRSGKSLSSASGNGSTASGGGQGWNSPADEGWRAAKVIASPAAGETTTAGLPKRVPRANLVPGSVGGGEDITEAVPPARSADTIRNRMASFQRGVREARAAAPQTEEP